MQDSQLRLQMAMAAAHMAIWDSTIVNGKIVDGIVSWSAEGARLLGLHGHSLRHSFRAFLTHVHEDDRNYILDILQNSLKVGGAYEVEYRVILPGGAVRWLAAKAHVLTNSAGEPERTLGIIWDTTEKREHEQLLFQEKELAQVTLSSIGDGVITVDAAGNTSFLNRVAEELTGWTNRQALHQPIEKVLRILTEETAEPGEHVVRKCLRLRHGIGISNRSVLLTKEGRHVPVEDSAAPIWSRDGEVLGVVLVFHDVSHERKLSKELNWQAAHDPLTGLVNRSGFERAIATALAGAKSERHVHALLYMDLDRFKIVNDTCGHLAGDLLLQLLSKMLQTHMRDADVLARLGGDELGVLLNHCHQDQAMQIANEIRQAIKDFRFVWENHSFELGVSIGMVIIDEASKSTTELLVAADQACYQAKEQGRNRVHLYQESDQRLAQRHEEVLWVARLNEAFERQQFRLFAQPILALNGDRSSHEEVLVRIAGRKGELIPPGAFIPAAERYDLMPAVDRWVFKHVCAHIAHAGNGQHFSVNLSGVSLGDEGLHEFMAEQFDSYKVEPRQISFEITETAIIANLTKAQEFMARMRRLGCRFSLDDFGSGLSSFAYLKSLDVDYLKIDGMFIRDLAVNPVNRAMVKAINEVGHVMGILTVAEYVENEANLAAVRELGLDFAQGYAVGQLRPLSLG